MTRYSPEAPARAKRELQMFLGFPARRAGDTTSKLGVEMKMVAPKDGTLKSVNQRKGLNSNQTTPTAPELFSTSAICDDQLQITFTALAVSSNSLAEGAPP
jgi:hypothetical protein